MPGTTAKDVINLVLAKQYFDPLTEISASSRTNAILIPHWPGSLGSLSEQIRSAMIEANQIATSTNGSTTARAGLENDVLEMQQERSTRPVLFAG